MTEYDNTNSGALFKNDDKDETHPNWPDYNGSIDVEGNEYWIKAWLKTAKKTGRKFMSLSVEPKQPQYKAADQPSLTDGPRPDDFDDDIPF